ncbi:MAG: excinuclease ABC subunit B [Candidatus Methanolliviera sp. GoM_oil]|nr:MAG: excinuclease ABC subunit B [Candidatus Methanolliviera sp. GoM_oil]
MVRGDIRVPNTAWDSRSNAHRAMAIYYKDILDYLERSKIDFSDDVLELIPAPLFKSSIKLRRYQQDALDAWLMAGKRGVIVLPTGSGKTLIALKAISTLNLSAIVIVPTLDLIGQWRSRISEEFDVEVGMYGGGEHILQPITVATYDTAYIMAGEIGNRFSLVIFDEVHHLPSSGYAHIAEMFASPYRMGLTATYERGDGLHSELPRLVGGKVYEIDVDALSGRYLSNYSLERITVDLTPEEEKLYEQNRDIFKTYLRNHHIILKTPRDFQRFVMRTGRDRGAREALLARNRAEKIALNSSSKIAALKKILKRHSDDRTIIFTQHNSLVHLISKKFLIPSITYKTPLKERGEILENFKRGRYRLIVTSKVLDEGVDVPEASIGIILSGSGSRREFIQRLGRILRPKRKAAILYEIVSRKTTEVGTARRRKEPL